MALLATVQPLDLGSPRSVAAYLLVLALAHTLPLAVRRRWPVAVLAVGLGTGAAFALLGFNLVVLTFALLVYVYTVATRRPRRVSLTGLAATEATIVLVWLVRPRAIGSDASTLVLDGLILAAAWSLGGRDPAAAGGGAPGQPGPGPRPPAPGLAEVEVLAAEVARAGVRWPGPGCGSRSGSRGRRRSCRPGWTCRPTGSSRRP